MDGVVEKISRVQDRELKVKVGSGGGSLGGSSASEESLEAEYIRRRTRFSIFESWYEVLKPKGLYKDGFIKLRKRKLPMSIGKFDGWGKTALEGIEPGDTVELKGPALILCPVALFR